MSEVSAESIHLVVTSPPYWQLKDYGSNEQIGYHDSYESYINNLNLVWKGCHRVLHPGCRLCINIGDQFARAAYYGRYKVIPIRTEIIRFCETLGFDYMGAIIWQKVTTCNTSGGATIMGSFPYPRNGVIKLDYEFILIFRKPGRAPPVSKEIKEQSRLSREEWNEYFYGHWNFSGARQDRHLATFPEELPRRLIKMFAFVGDTVLDPFLGSGTTCIAALELGRSSVGYEINEQYAEVAKRGLLEGADVLQQDAEVETIRQTGPGTELSSMLRELPYVFRDPVPFERKGDPKSLSYGFRVDGTEESTRTYHTVKAVLSPTDLVLNNGTVVRLIGVTPDGQGDPAAIRFLEAMTKGQKVYLKREEHTSDRGGVLPRYVYLKNRTFVNAHLLRSGLVEVDTISEYRLRARFMRLRARVAEGDQA